MEKELRSIKNRGYFPVPQITPQDSKIETACDKEKILETVDEMATAMLQAITRSEEAYMREQNQARARDEQLRSVRQTDRSGFNYFTLANSTPIRNDNARSDPPGVHFNTNPICHIYSTMSDGNDQYEPPVNDSIIQKAASAPTDQLATNTTGVTGHNDPWRCNNGMGTATSTATHRMSTAPTSHNGLHNNISPNSSDNRNGPICYRCGEQGHMRSVCRERVFCDHCKTYNHDTKACRKQHNNIPSPTNSQITAGYHPTVTPPPLMGTNTTTTQQAGVHNNNPLFQNLLDNNQPRTSTMIQTPHNGTSPTTPANLVEGITQIMNQVTNNNKRDDASKQMMKNIKIFDGSNKAECINCLSQVEAAARLTNTPFRELICQSMAPTMLHIFSELSALPSDEDIKEAILTNYSDILSTTEAATWLQNIQISASEPLVTFNHRYEAIHKVAFGISTKQENKTVRIEYAKKLPVNTRDKLLRKIAKKNSYIKTLDDAFKQAIDINRETSFVEVATGKYNDQIGTKIEMQINKLEDSFQEYDINTMNTRSTNRSGDGSWNRSFDRSLHRNNSFNSSQNSRSNYRGNSYSCNDDS